MERLKYMKETLMNCVQGQLGDLSSVDAGELGAAIDMIKDLEEAIYYATIVKSMEEKENGKDKYYPVSYNYMPERYMDMGQGKMYYNGNDSYSGNRGSQGNSGRREYPIEIRDAREGMSPVSRRMYMESKELHKDKNVRMKELDKYMHELTDDIKEMIEDASPEEKQMLQEKIATLAHKVV